MIKFTRIKIIYSFLFIILYLVNTSHGNVRESRKVQRIVEGPVNTTVYVGDTVSLKCRVENQEGTVQWLLEGFGLGTERELPMFKQFKMVGSPMSGEYDLLITNVTGWEDGFYECQVTSSKDSDNFEKTKPAYLEVLKTPDDYGIYDKQNPGKKHKNGDFVFTKEGIPLEETCFVEKSHPPPKLYWAITKSGTLNSILSWIGDEVPDVIYDKYFRNSTIPFQSGTIKGNSTFDRMKQFTTFSKVTTMIDPKYDGMKLSCIIIHQTYNEPQLSSVTLNLLYKPIVSVTIDSENESLKQGDEIRLICNVNAKPESDGKYTWYHNNELLKKATKKVLYIEHLIPDDHNSRFTCRTSNALGVGSGTIQLNVLYEPKFISTSQVMIVHQNDQATFSCETHGNPQPKVFWRKSGDGQIIYEGVNFTINDVQKWQTGEYECVAMNKGFDPVILSHNLFIEGDLQVRANETVYVDSESTGTLSCEFHGYPKPRDIIWTLNGQNIVTGRPSKRFNVVQVEKNYGVESKLVIYDVEGKDLGNYNCTASTMYATISATMSLRSHSVIYKVSGLIKKIDSDILLTLLIILVCGILLPCILGMLYCFYNNRYKKRKSVYRLGSKKHIGDIQVECAAIDDVNFASVELLHNERSNSNGGLIYNKVYESINQNNPDLDYNASYDKGSYQTGYPVTFITTDSNSSQATTVLRYDGYGNNTTTFCGGDRNDFMTMEPLREIITPDNESGTPLLNACVDNNGNSRDSPVSRVSTHV
uniref:Ig-like domain-containing protein n=1 Tax=Strongyloides papillosus TaxID=174720 RepID=A0A0N5BEG0_STREA